MTATEHQTTTPAEAAPSAGLEIHGEALTERERFVLSLVAKGETTGAIARRMELSTRAIDNEVHSIKLKLGAVDKAHAVSIAYEAKLLPLYAVAVADRDLPEIEFIAESGRIRFLRGEKLLAVARRSNGRDCDWIGWQVVTVVDSRGAAFEAGRALAENSYVSRAVTL